MSQGMKFQFGQLCLSSDIPLTFQALPSETKPSLHLSQVGPQSNSLSGDMNWSEDKAFRSVGINFENRAFFSEPDGRYYRLFLSYEDQFAEFLIDLSDSHILCRSNNPDGMIAMIEGMVLGNYHRLKGLTPIHASVVTRNGDAIAIAGQSGAGKSSLTWTLLQQGFQLLSDDLLLFDPSPDGIIAYPGRLRLRLNAVAAQGFKIDSALCQPVFDLEDMDKVAVHNPQWISPDPAPVEALLILQPRNSKLEDPEVVWRHGPDKIADLIEHLYGRITPSKEAKKRQMERIMALASQVRLAHVTLPNDFDALPRHAETLIKRLDV